MWCVCACMPVVQMSCVGMLVCLYVCKIVHIVHITWGTCLLPAKFVYVYRVEPCGFITFFYVILATHVSPHDAHVTQTAEQGNNAALVVQSIPVTKKSISISRV